jgi:hypothetical protein
MVTIIHFGTGITRAYKEINGQYICSKCFYILTPLFIINTYLVVIKDKENVKNIELNSQNKALLFSWGFFFCLVGIFLSIIFGVILVPEILSYGRIIFDELFYLFLIIVLPLLILGTLMILFYFKLARNLPYEVFVREQFYKITGYYIMPEWIYNSTFSDIYESSEDFFSNIYESMKNNYKQKTGNCDWEIALKLLNPLDELFALTFCLTYIDNFKNKNKLANNILMEKYKMIGVELLEKYKNMKRIIT